MINSILDAAEPLYVDDGRTVFDADALAKLNAAAGSEGPLLAIVRDDTQTLARRFAAVEGLRQLGWTTWTTSDADARTVAHLMAQAILVDEIHNRWGLPGYDVGVTGKLMTSLSAGVEDALKPLLDEGDRLKIIGSQEATTDRTYQFRIADLAAFLLAEHLGTPWHPAETAAERDKANAGLR